jgi:hypothetical protein
MEQRYGSPPIAYASLRSGFVLISVVRARQDGAAFVPDDLLRVEKSDAQQA